ncbi:MAG TPA: TolC family protein [Candidatus Acidoferrum sp.]|nr:TolC family protein [Candidatus Acidoferrum sp.]
MGVIRNILTWSVASIPLFSQPAGSLFHPYRQPSVAPPDLTNSSRIENLVRAGNLYLSLQDTIALALENNLDIAIQRYGPLQAESDLKRAQAGGPLRGGSSGPAIPSLDPVIQGQTSYGHTTAPQTSSFLTGASTLVSRSKTANFSISQNWLTGTSGSLTFNNGTLAQNSLTNNFNPYTSSSLDVLITQHLLQGFGTALNSREIRVARNNIDASRFNFELQVINTIAAVSTLYWDLVSFNEQVKVAQSAFAAAHKLYEDNRKQVDAGYLAPIAVVQAEAEVANRQQDLTIAETNVSQQETVLKNALSKNGTASPSLADARIVTTDHIQVPAIEPVQPVQDLIALALENRPDLKSSRVNLDSSRIRLAGSRNALLPTVDAFAEATNHGLAGQVNSIAGSPGAGGNPFYQTGTPDPYFIGGYGTALAQLFRRNFPDYRVGISLTIPLRNRAAQADYVRDHLDYYQSEMQLRKQVNQIRVDVQNGVIALRQSHARYQAAVQSRILEEQTLDAEEKKYQAGASTVYNVIQIQRDLANARGNEVTAESSYIRARTNLDTILGATLQVNHVSIEEARHGAVARPPDPIPAAADNGRTN